MTEKLSRRNWLKTGAFAGATLALLPNLANNTEAANFRTEKIVRLWANENPYGFSPKAQQAIIDSVHLGNQYATKEQITKLKQMIAKREGLKPENVIIGSGSGEILSMTGAAYGWQGGEIVIADPSFPMVTNYAEKFGAKIIKVPLNEKHEHDLKALEKPVTSKTSMVYVCNPNNPTATYLSKEKVKDFCEEISRRTTVFVDEAYLEYTKNFPRNSMVELVKKDKNIIVTRTFSKIYGMAGMRVGYGLAKPEIIKKINNFHMTGFNSLGINAAIVAYQDTNFIKESKRKNNIVRANFLKETDKLNMPSAESHGNFIWIYGGKRFKNLHEKIRPTGLHVYSSSPKNIGWARITIGTEKDMKLLAKEFRKL